MTERETPPAPEPGRARVVALASLRLVRGLVGLGVAAAVVGTVGLVSAPDTSIEPLGVTVEPQPADLLELCAGPLLRLGDPTGTDTEGLYAVGEPERTVASSGDATVTHVTPAGSASGDAAPAVLRLHAEADASLAAAQAQRVRGDGGLVGLSASTCSEPASSSWLVGGSTEVGRTTLLLLANPSEVTAEVTIRMWGESGPVAARGMGGVLVAPGTQRVIPLSGFAPDVASPVVHVASRGGQVVAALQSSVVRVLDPGGVELTGAGAAPAREAIVPAVRVFDAAGVSRATGLADHEDLEPMVRIANPGDTEAHVDVSLLPASGDGLATSFELHVDPGGVTDFPLASALELGQGPLPDDSYTIVVRSDEPVVVGARAATTPAPGADADGSPVAGPVDIAWFASAPPLTGDRVVAIADGPSPVLVAYAADGAARTLLLEPVDGGETLELEVPAGAPAAIAVERGTGYRLGDAEGLHVAVSFARAGELSGYTVRSPRAADSAIIVRP